MISSQQAITDLLFIPDNLPAMACLAVVMGSRQLSLMDPAISAYKQGVVPRILITGGDPPKHPGHDMTECEELAEYAVANGIPQEALLLEDRSQNTLENVLFASEIIERDMGWDSVRSVLFCCKGFHSRRVLMTATQHWPVHVQYHFQTVPSERLGIRREDWWKHPDARQRVLGEVARIAEYSLKGDIAL